MKYIFLMTFLLAGCKDISNERAKILLQYKCTATQLVLVEREYKLCNQTSYLSSYCYETAKKTQCTLIKN